MDVAAKVADIQPLTGQVVPIRTVQETRPPEEFSDAYVAEVNIKSASNVIKALDGVFPRDPSLPLAHLRRFAKREALPAPLRSALEVVEAPAPDPTQTIFVLISPPLPDVLKLQTLLAPFAPGAAPTSAAPPPPHPSTSESTLDSSSPSANIRLLTTKVPLYPPFNAHQAETWTRTLWPVVFNPAAPRAIIAPPPQILNRAQADIQTRAGYYLALAQKVAEEAKQSGLGRAVGAVIVDPAIEAELDAASREDGLARTDQWPQPVVAVAGDARYSRPEGRAPSQAELHAGVAPNPASETYNADLEGGPELHALMRGVEMVARRRRGEDPHTRTATTSTAAQLSPLESHFLYQADSPTANQPHHPPDSPSSPKKRKHESPNPEFSSTAMDLTQAPPSSAPPLPAPPPSSTALPDSAAAPAPTPSSLQTTHSAPINPRIRTRAQGGYLCTDLDVYISHEPCLCCSMGILLSRFRAVVFSRRGRMRTGGLASEPVVRPTLVHEPGSASVAAEDDDPPAGTEEEQAPVTGEEGKENEEIEDSGQERLYYGLHWRKELNWRALGFEFVEDGMGNSVPGDDDDELAVFHA